MTTASPSVAHPGVLTAALALPAGVRLAAPAAFAAGFPVLAGAASLALAGPWVASLTIPAGATMPGAVRRATGFPA